VFLCGVAAAPYFLDWLFNDPLNWSRDFLSWSFFRLVIYFTSNLACSYILRVLCDFCVLNRALRFRVPLRIPSLFNNAIARLFFYNGTFILKGVQHRSVPEVILIYKCPCHRTFSFLDVYFTVSFEVAFVTMHQSLFIYLKIFLNSIIVNIIIYDLSTSPLGWGIWWWIHFDSLTFTLYWRQGIIVLLNRAVWNPILQNSIFRTPK